MGILGLYSNLGASKAFLPIATSNGLKISRFGVAYELYTSIAGLQYKGQLSPRPVRCFIKMLA